MLFSIIIPAYNAASSLPETLSTIYQQTYDGYEIILINDGSADATESVCKVFCESHNNTHYVDKIIWAYMRPGEKARR